MRTRYREPFPTSVAGWHLVPGASALRHPELPEGTVHPPEVGGIFHSFMRVTC